MPLPMSDTKSIRAEMERVNKIREQSQETVLPNQPIPPPLAESSSVSHTLKTADPQAIECVVCLGMFVWGFWLMFSPNPLLEIGLGEVAPTWAWGGALVVLGLSHLFGVLYSLGDLRRRSAYWSFFVWAMATIASLIAAAPGSISIAYGIITVLSAWVYIRVEK